MERRSWSSLPLGRAARLRCPRCGGGRLFSGWFRMADGCPACGLSYAREPGFYLGSIYVNYGVTVLATGGLYAAGVGWLGWSQPTALAAALGLAVILPILFFRHARALLLALDASVNRHQGHDDARADGSRSLADLGADDARAGCMMGAAVALVMLFGLAMAVATLVFSGAFSAPAPEVSDPW